MDEIEHGNPKRIAKRLTAHGHVARVDPAALHERAAAARRADRPKADAKALGLLSRSRRAP